MFFLQKVNKGDVREYSIVFKKKKQQSGVHCMGGITLNSTLHYACIAYQKTKRERSEKKDMQKDAKIGPRKDDVSVWRKEMIKTNPQK